jgi:hypothetical protein
VKLETLYVNKNYSHYMLKVHVLWKMFQFPMTLKIQHVIEELIEEFIKSQVNPYEDNEVEHELPSSPMKTMKLSMNEDTRKEESKNNDINIMQ